MRGPQYTLLSQNMLQVSCGKWAIRFRTLRSLQVSLWNCDVMSRKLNADRLNLSLYLLLTCACAYSYNAWQDVFETTGQFVDGLKFSGGSHSLMPKSSIKEVIDMAHKHDVYVSTGDWAEHLLRKGPSSSSKH
ncbi:PREDICTED: uncharacterized protein LOC105110151 isoform X2 [Populus euphratica]|nr:PREDICTED: uncharacterized protein LOC105110151 isoform X2 [Populus euphratica]